MPLAVSVLVFVGHALYIRHAAAIPVGGWADEGITGGGFWGLGPYFAAQDYFLGFSYALGAGFATWAGLQFIRQRRARYRDGREYYPCWRIDGGRVLPDRLPRLADARRVPCAVRS